MPQEPRRAREALPREYRVDRPVHVRRRWFLEGAAVGGLESDERVLHAHEPPPSAVVRFLAVVLRQPSPTRGHRVLAAVDQVDGPVHRTKDQRAVVHKRHCVVLGQLVRVQRREAGVGALVPVELGPQYFRPRTTQLELRRLLHQDLVAQVLQQQGTVDNLVDILQAAPLRAGVHDGHGPIVILAPRRRVTVRRRVDLRAEHDGEVAEGQLVPGLVGVARGVARPVLSGVAARHGEDVAHLAPGRGTSGVSSGACHGFELGLVGLRALPVHGRGVRYGAGVVAQAAREVVEDLPRHTPPAVLEWRVAHGLLAFAVGRAEAPREAHLLPRRPQEPARPLPRRVQELERVVNAEVRHRAVEPAALDERVVKLPAAARRSQNSAAALHADEVVQRREQQRAQDAEEPDRVARPERQSQVRGRQPVRDGAPVPVFPAGREPRPRPVASGAPPVVPPAPPPRAAGLVPQEHVRREGEDAPGERRRPAPPGVGRAARRRPPARAAGAAARLATVRRGRAGRGQAGVRSEHAPVAAPHGHPLPPVPRRRCGKAAVARPRGELRRVPAAPHVAHRIVRLVAAAVLVRREGAGQRTAGPPVARGEADGEGIRRAARRTSLLRAPAGPVMEGGGGGGDVALDEVQELGGRDGLVVAHLSGVREKSSSHVDISSRPKASPTSLAVLRGRSQTGSLHDQSPDITQQVTATSREPRSRASSSTCLAARANPEVQPGATELSAIVLRPNPNLMMMRCVPCEGGGDETCANCGKTGSETVKLKNCTACRLVKYCGVDCQRAHRKKHKVACKQRVAELKDEQLYSQGLERPEGDFCPICTLPIPLPTDLQTSPPGNNSDMLAMIQARVGKNDPVAICFLGKKYFFGDYGLKKDMERAVKLWEQAAELGSVDALFSLGNSYDFGNGVKQDKAKAVAFYAKAAMQGHVDSRHNLGCFEGKKGNHDRAVRHWLISAKMGEEQSLDELIKKFFRGFATKEQYAEALKGYQDAVEEMKSHDRDEAKAYLDNRK
ncbi:hypothetical protein THAOC_32033 [Thalassiosira oceanica]|uniref:MYND-type domain-containing protein n=1 Tax=Thalassiosira oceanica TaxID=159749 RepID=K0RJT9_THAOC|nr:hypothetical protein THAOC_32033 [Thalassiosira oceanica]|eukprot:EJK49121.1 hypothetical protein THAOC_32033 [Thalassiosira oceanica]